MRHSICKLVVIGLISFIAGQASANDTPNTVAKPDNLTIARQQVAQKNWPAAVTELKRVNETSNADWHNLMGFSLRKGEQPDLASAERHYKEALRIDPKHKGALEYSGELYLMLGDLPKAEEQLMKLDKACFFSCEEFDDLKKAVARFKSNGNKYLAEK